MFKKMAAKVCFPFSHITVYMLGGEHLDFPVYDLISKSNHICFIRRLRLSEIKPLKVFH